MWTIYKHFKTITTHKILVMKGCFSVGLYGQGLLHDLSKYSLSEFMVGIKYYQGTRSPNNAEREDKGYSYAWLHHKGRNKHHYEYWLDYTSRVSKDTAPIAPLVPVPMPNRYIVEMFIDRIAASKIYEGENYTDRAPLIYYKKGKEQVLIHPETKEKLEKLLVILAVKGEKKAMRYVKKVMLKK